MENNFKFRIRLLITADIQITYTRRYCSNMESVRILLRKLFPRNRKILLSDIIRNRISELTQNSDIVRTACSMVAGKLDIDATNEDGVTLFYLAIRNMEWDVAEYLLDLGADPTLVPPKVRSNFWVLKFSDFDESHSMADQVENRIECVHRLHTLGVLNENYKEFTKCLLFVGRCDLKDVIKGIKKILPGNTIKSSVIVLKNRESLLSSRSRIESNVSTDFTH